MSAVNQKAVWAMTLLLLACLVAGCGGPTGGTTKDLAPTTDLGPTIGSLAKVFTVESMAVEGYGLVGGLNGTGSVECPPKIRTYLSRYIMTQLPEYKGGIGKLIGRRDTAVVRLEGTVPAGAWKGQSFDIRVSVVPGTQTTSLEDGWLYTAELKAKGTFGATTKVIASAEGPIFIDKMGRSRPNRRLGYVLAGGTVLNEYNVAVELREPDYRVASQIRNRLNERFAYGSATAVSPERIDLTVPAEHKKRKDRFVSIVKATYLDQTPEITRERVKTFVRRLAVSKDKYASEIALEAIGKESLRKLPILLNSSGEEVRLQAARCMLNLGSDTGLQTLRQIVLDKGSPYRIEALEAITGAARRDDTAAIARKLLRDDNFDIRLAAYRQLRALDDIGVTRTLVARSFNLEEVVQNDRKVIYASRSGQAQIVLFGAPILCRKDIFVQSADGKITVNAPPGQKYVLAIRKHPTEPATIGSLKSSFKLSDIIRALCEEPVRVDEQWRGGLGVSYADVIVLLKEMCDKGAVSAEFRAGPLPKIG